MEMFKLPLSPFAHPSTLSAWDPLSQPVSPSTRRQHAHSSPPLPRVLLGAESGDGNLPSRVPHTPTSCVSAPIASISPPGGCFVLHRHPVASSSATVSLRPLYAESPPTLSVGHFARPCRPLRVSGPYST